MSEAVEISSDSEAEGQQPTTARKTPAAFYSWLLPSFNLHASHGLISVYEFVRLDLLEFHRNPFSLAGLEHPKGWDDISGQHLDLMKEHNFNLFHGMHVLNERLLPITKPAMEKVLDKMLCDDSVSFFLKSLIPAVGAMFVVEDRSLEKDPSPYLKTDTVKAASTKVLDVLQAQKLRDEFCDLKKQGAEATLMKMIAIFTGKNKSDSVKFASGDMHLTSQKSLSVIATHGAHTTLTHLEIGAQDGKVVSSTYDSFHSRAQMDPQLRQAFDFLLTKVKLKKGNFIHKSPTVTRQKDGKVCALMALTCLTQILTGETLDGKHWSLYVDLVRLWMFLKLHAEAVSSGAIRGDRIASPAESATRAPKRSRQ